MDINADAACVEYIFTNYSHINSIIECTWRIRKVGQLQNYANLDGGFRRPDYFLCVHDLKKSETKRGVSRSPEYTSFYAASEVPKRIPCGS